MNGLELASRLRKQRPEMKVLYVSGFADRAFENFGGPGPDEAFMEKPYSFQELARKIHEMLNVAD
jgi:two-component SAPR family response regulator